MKKTAVMILKVVGVIAALLFAAIIVIELLGFRFISENVFEPGHGEDRVIRTDDWDFYYLTIPDVNDQDEYPVMICPVKKYGFLYKRLDKYDPEFRVYTADEDEYVGILYRFEGKETEYYIFLFAFFSESTNWASATSVTINGQENELLQKIFFSTNEEFSSFSIGECELKLVPIENE